MATNLKLIVALGLFAVVLSKKTNDEELDLDQKNTKAREFMNLFDNDESNSRNQRYARHLKAVTESVLDHVINEIRHEYIQKTYPNSPIRRLIHTLNGEMQKEHHAKIAKEKLEKEMAEKLKTKLSKGKKKKMPKKKKIPKKKKVPKKKKTPKKQKSNLGKKSTTPKKATNNQEKDINWRIWRSNLRRDV